MSSPIRGVGIKAATCANHVREIPATVEQLEEDISWFAVLVWDKQGDMRIACDPTRGPKCPVLVPSLVSDALNRHVAVKLAEERLADSGHSGTESCYFFRLPPKSFR